MQADAYAGYNELYEETRKPAPIIELPVESNFIGKLIGMAGAHASEKPVLPGQLLEFARALAPFAVHPADSPLMRLEITAVE